MIGSILITLRPQEEIIVFGKGEEELYYLLLRVLKEHDEELMKEIHESTKEIPLTISPLIKGTKSSRGYSYLSPNQSTNFRITYLKEEFLEPILKGFLSFSGHRKHLPLSKGKVLVDKVDWQKGSNAKVTSFEDIASRSGNERSISLEFCSPTTFLEIGEESLFPLPELVFSSLLRKWSAFSGKKLPQKMKAGMKNIRVVQFRLITEHLRLSQGKLTGFMGKVMYELEDSLSIGVKKALNTLAEFSFYSGVGSHTIMGMGQTRRVK